MYSKVKEYTLTVPLIVTDAPPCSTFGFTAYGLGASALSMCRGVDLQLQEKKLIIIYLFFPYIYKANTIFLNT